MSEKPHDNESRGTDAGSEQSVAATPPAQTGTEGGAPTGDGPTHRDEEPASLLHQILSGSALMSVLAVVLALVLGGVLIAFADEATRAATGYFFSRPGDTFAAAWSAVSDAYVAMFRGSVLDWRATTFAGMIKPLTESMVFAIPLILAGLGIAVGFRAGLFNIGAQGQIIVGAIVAAYVGFAWDLPPVIHLLAAILGGAIGGAVWAFIPGILKARFGANEVIVTIMLNYVAVNLIGYMLKRPAFNLGRTGQKSPPVEENALFPALIPDWLVPGNTFRLHWGFVVAILATVFVWWLLERSTIGFQIRAAGANPAAARTAGMSVGRVTVITMVIAGALAGLAASGQVLGTERALTAGVAASFGFDAITVALLGRSRPWGTFFAGLLFGALKSGGFLMQSLTSTPIDIVLVVQSLIVLLIAAPPLVRSVFRLPAPGARPRRQRPRNTTAKEATA
ncbi:ABC transporter permease [Ornithinimicrobium flavum]|uniref:ABC transporter permease n=1 Tax=Ornithinimicrobium flavum TaxID=1288636 RepID=UPI001EE8A62A|nr:ABC transporter permease [Ornithinimicrobium flavum]